MSKQANVAHFLTASEWAANDRRAANKARPFPSVARFAHLPDHKDGYFQTVDGRWWTNNAQLGHVEVLPTSRALIATLARIGGA